MKSTKHCVRFLQKTTSLLMLTACSTTATLESDQPAQGMLLDNEFEVHARLGTLPITLNSKRGIFRYAVANPGRDYDYLIVVDPVDADGALKLPVEKEEVIIESAGSKGFYIDKILAIHRLILAGRIDDAEEKLSALTKQEHSSYGTYILSGIIASINSEYLKASKYFSQAEKMLPSSAVIDDLKKFPKL